MSTVVRARAPLRLGLAGGGTDVAPYCDLYGGYVLNATIDRYAYATITLLDDKRLVFRAADQVVSEEHAMAAKLAPEGQLKLHRAVYTRMVREFNNDVPVALELTTFSDAPAGSGLGASSTLVVVMIRAFVELFNLALDDYAVAQLAYQIERIDCGLEGGRQDQYAATFGGFNFMEFYDEGKTVVNPLRIKNWVICELEASLILFYLGVSRESARIISDQIQNVRGQDERSLTAMHNLKREAITMKECLLRADFHGLVDSMRLGWENKKKSASTVSNTLIDEVYATSLQAGALAGKVSGAGGGGFMMFFVPPELRANVISALGTFTGKVQNCHFTKHGTQAWRIK